jgi:hypothetical protein
MLLVILEIDHWHIVNGKFEMESTGAVKHLKVPDVQTKHATLYKVL